MTLATEMRKPIEGYLQVDPEVTIEGHVATIDARAEPACIDLVQGIKGYWRWFACLMQAGELAESRRYPGQTSRP